jgi:hypothetical protein
MVFTVNSDYFFEQHQPVVLIGEERRFLWGTAWIFKY